MTVTRTTGLSPALAGRLHADADRLGDADGVATAGELAAVAAQIRADAPHFDRTARARADHAQALGQAAVQAPVTTLPASLRSLPEATRRLALEIDALWGNADGQITPDEVDRVARFTLATLPMFGGEASALLAIADQLGFVDNVPPAAQPHVLALRTAVLSQDAETVAKNRPYRALFDEAMAIADRPGAPELLRTAGQHNPNWHSLSILEHTAAAADAIATLCAKTGLDWPEAPGVMLLHDVGKILDRQARPEDASRDWSFWDHEHAGAAWLDGRGVDERTRFHVAHHADLRSMNRYALQGLAGGPARLAEMLVVYVADQVAKGDRPAQIQSFKDQAPKIRALCDKAGIDADALFAAADDVRARWFDMRIGPALG